MTEYSSPKCKSAEHLRVSDFDYDLPEDLIAQQPPAQRGTSRMMVMDRTTGRVEDSFFNHFVEHLRPGDLLVLNDSRVIPARLYARRTLRRERTKPTGRIEVMLTEPVTPQSNLSQPSTNTGAPHLDSEMWEDKSANQWRALVRPGRKVSIGERLVFPAPSGEILLEAEVLDRGLYGERLLAFSPVDESIAGDFFAILDRIGHIPLPPYIHRDDATSDRERYQTVFAEERGSVAAPTAGLHFTPEVLAQLSANGIEIARVTLHVGLGTFAPLRVERVDEVHLHRERYSISAEAANSINSAARSARRIVAVGTTVVRTLESAAQKFSPGQLQPHSATTEIFISPGFEFRLVGAMLTNFHLPQSSLLMLVSAFAGREQILAAYRHAIEQNYRFFSYGDCMLIA
jgi:S-adenosylmethionine:tRNA ribosyltransferase-isomerase